MAGVASHNPPPHPVNINTTRPIVIPQTHMHAYYNTKAQMSEQLKSPIYYRQHCIVCTETCTCTAEMMTNRHA